MKELDDGLLVEGPARVSPTRAIRTHGDHRIAMAMAVLAIFSDAPVCIGNVACVDTSYPEFWNQLQQLGVNVE